MAVLGFGWGAHALIKVSLRVPLAWLFGWLTAWLLATWELYQSRQRSELSCQQQGMAQRATQFQHVYA